MLGEGSHVKKNINIGRNKDTYLKKKRNVKVVHL